MRTLFSFVSLCLIFGGGISFQNLHACPVSNHVHDNSRNKFIEHEKGVATRIKNVPATNVSGRNPLCGIYAMIGALKAENVDYEVESMFSRKYVSSTEGSSALELCSLATDQGGFAKTFFGMNLQSLKSSDSPVLLRLKLKGAKGSQHHWVTYLGDDQGKAVVFDAPNQPNTISYAVLLSNWDGHGIVVSDEPINNALHVVIPRLEFLNWVLPSALILISLFVIQQRWARKCSSNQLVFFQVIWIVAATAVWAMGFHLIANVGFANNRVAIAHAQKNYIPLEEFPTIDGRALKMLMANEMVTLVDARPASLFEQNHLPNAINLPIDAPIGEIATTLEEVGRSKFVVVYCQNSSCEWDRNVAQQFKAAGYNNIVLFTPGMEACDFLSKRMSQNFCF